MKFTKQQKIFFIIASVVLFAIAYAFGYEARIFGTKYFHLGIKYDSFLFWTLAAIPLGIIATIIGLRKIDIKQSFVSFLRNHSMKFILLFILIIAGGGAGFENNTIRVYNVKLFGAGISGSSDDTPGIQAAMDAAHAAGEGTVYAPYPGRDYLIAGALRLNSGTDSSQLIIPYNGTLENLGAIKILGEAPVNNFTDYRQDSIPHKMVVFRSTSTKASAVFGTTASNYTDFTIENICVRVRSRTAALADTSAIMTAMDLRRMNMIHVINCRFDTESGQKSGLQPASTAIGLRLPPSGNYAFIQIDGVLIQNFYTGITASEHANIDNTFIATCFNAISFTSNPHPALVNRMTIAWCKYNVVLDGTCIVNFNQLDIEDYNAGGGNPSKWFNHVYDFYEPSGSGSKVNSFYLKNVANAVGTIPLDNSVTSTAVIATPIGTLLGLPAKTTVGLYDYYPYISSTNRYPNLTINSTDASGQGGVIFQRSGTSLNGLVGNPAGTAANDFGMYDYVNGRVVWYYASSANDLILNTGITAKLNGDLILSTSGAKIGVGITPTYQYHSSGAAVSNINMLVNSTGGVGRIAVNSVGGNSGVTLQESGSNKYSFFSAGGVFGVYNDANARYSMQISTSNNMAIGDISPTSAKLTVDGNVNAVGAFDFGTTTTPAPASGHAVLWFDGTNVKVTKNVGGTTTTAVVF